MASLLTYVALLKSEQGDVGGCLAPLLRAQRIRKLTGTLETAAGVALCRAIGLTLEELGDFERAFEAYEAAQQLRRRTGCLEAPPLRSEHVVPKLEAEKQVGHGRVGCGALGEVLGARHGLHVSEVRHGLKPVSVTFFGAKGPNSDPFSRFRS